jgi:hypothetical protein
MSPPPVSDCELGILIGSKPPLARCDLVARVEAAESTLSDMGRQMRSLSWKLSLVVGAAGVVSPHLLAVCEWLGAHVPPPATLLSLVW